MAARVTMVVNNGMANDARVIKSAVTLRRAGAHVTVLGVASAGAKGSRACAGGVVYERLPALPGRGPNARYVAFAVRRRAGRLVPAERWARSLPVTGLYARSFVPALRASAPDAVHVHDVHLLDAVARAFPDRATRPAVVYDAHEYVASLAVSGARTQRAVDAWAALERDRIGIADRVVTVAPEIAERLARDHRLSRSPAVVYNAPVRWPQAHSSLDLRGEAGVSTGTPLAVYSGALSRARGLGTVIEALPRVPRLHLAIVAVPHPHPMSAELMRQAAALGVADRVHIVPPVPSHEVPAYLAVADLGVSAIIGDSVSYDLALPNKLFEMVHAGLTIVTSDIRAMSHFVLEHRLGEVFRQGDAQSCAVALRTALERPAAATVDERDALAEEFSWQGQEPALVQVYRDLSDRRLVLGDLVVPTSAMAREDLTLEFA
ncbi:MAG: glycosyltransferase [Dermatophilaceae bacterium]